MADESRPREPNLADSVYDRLMQEIIDGRFAIGARLPAEQSLSADYKVSRPVLREALARLRKDGIIATRQGSGNYVSRRPDRSVGKIVPLSSLSDIQRCYEFRIDFEPLCAKWAAIRRTDEQLLQLERAIARFNDTFRQHETGTDADLEIHMIIARSSANQFHIAAMETMASQIAFGMHLSRSLTLRATTQRYVIVEAEHHRIFQAIAAKDSEAAQQAMHDHLTGALERMYSGS
ncbi:FadR/GntR family transcriptional regulator [Devosia marina]|uniref:GntR family transcriptional regulator n=1 Tax=Devosia marina TaxID=2683198 RepID=A0A7X3FQN6_9HYPH|nr:FadR/GntR family transcriptional regulator [Devosia marina]MVS98833.1 GntR family transcriptional regulator [Devosia marina]